MLDNATFARNFKALAHPRRAHLFSLLVRQPEAGDSLDTLITASGLAYSSAVHHLREMERGGLVKRRRKGPQMAYRLAPGEFTMALAQAMRMSEAARAAPRPRAVSA